MLDVNDDVNEPQANPYNSKKSWHTPDAPSRGSADGMYYEEETQSKATRSSAPSEESSEKGSSNYKKRYDDLKKHYDQRIAEFKQRELQLKAASQEQQVPYAPPKSKEDLQTFRTQYPDLYDTVETVAHLKSAEQLEALKAKMAIIEEREAAIGRKEAEATLRSRHPDFEDIRGDEKFHAWAKEQPEQIQDWIYNNPNNVPLAIKAIDLYKMETGLSTKAKQPTGKSQSARSAADMVSTKTTNVDTKEPKIWSQREIAKLSMVQFDKYESEIDQAILEGRIVD